MGRTWCSACRVGKDGRSGSPRCALGSWSASWAVRVHSSWARKSSRSWRAGFSLSSLHPHIPDCAAVRPSAANLATVLPGLVARQLKTPTQRAGYRLAAVQRWQRNHTGRRTELSQVRQRPASPHLRPTDGPLSRESKCSRDSRTGFGVDGRPPLLSGPTFSGTTPRRWPSRPVLSDAHDGRWIL